MNLEYTSDHRTISSLANGPKARFTRAWDKNDVNKPLAEREISVDIELLRITATSDEWDQIMITISALQEEAAIACFNARTEREEKDEKAAMAEAAGF